MEMDAKISISIVICTWNRADQLITTLESLALQEINNEIDLEVIVVDNNSSDNTENIVREFSKNWKLGNLRYIFEPNQGKQFALNTGICHSKYEIIGFTDDDIIFPKNWVSEIGKIFLDTKIDLVGGKTLITWPSTGQPVWYHPCMSAILGGVDLGDDRYKPAPPDYAPAGANMVARRSLFLRIGSFSETHFRHMDFEFGMRSHRMGAAISYEPTLMVFAPVDDTCLTKRYFRRWSFKAGIAHETNEQSNGKTILAVPRWVYRQLFQDVLHLVFGRRDESSAEKFAVELRALRNFGKIATRWHEKLQPSKHDKWIKKYSQKKNNLY